MIEKIRHWAKTQTGIRVVLLTSSRAGNKKSSDHLSDYDIELYVDDPRPYTEDSKWLEYFGSILIMLPEKRILLGIEQPARMVIYEDGTKVDFTIIEMDILKQIIDLPSLPDWLDNGYRVLLDKDGVTKKLRKPAYKAYIPKKPTNREFQELINEFWWETTYVAKNLRRGEILPAKYSSDYVIRYKVLLKMLEWYVQINRGWSCQTGFVGKGIMNLLSTDEQDELKNIFSGADLQENWQALSNTTRFFGKISVKVANNLGYKYPYELDENVSGYIGSIWKK